MDCDWDMNDRRKHCELVIELKGQMQALREILEKEAIQRREWRENINLSITNMELKVSKIMEIANRLYFPYKVIIIITVGLISFAATKLAEIIHKIIAAR